MVQSSEEDTTGINIARREVHQVLSPKSYQSPTSSLDRQARLSAVIRAFIFIVVSIWLDMVNSMSLFCMRFKACYKQTCHILKGKEGTRQEFPP